VDGAGGASPDAAGATRDAGARLDLQSSSDSRSSGGADAGTMGPVDAEGSHPAPFAAAAVFDLKVLHRIEIQVDSRYLAQLDVEKEKRVPCSIKFDGTSLPNSGIRKKGGNGSWRPLGDKPSFSIKFNELVTGQKLLGLTKLLLNNAVQDPSFLNEHMVYEIGRRIGLAAPLTAHGLVTFNGMPYGLYVVREAMNDGFLRRSFGKENEDGNLYEGGEFAESPDSPELKDELEEMRSRADIRELSRLIKTTPDAQWVAVVGAKMDIPSFLAGYALESLIDHWDGYFFGPHNYYIYNHPGIGRFVFLPAGADSVFGRVRDPRLDPKVLPAKKLLAITETKAQLAAKLTDAVRNLDLAELHARIDQAAQTVRSYTPTDPRTTADFRSFQDKLAEKKSAMTRLKNWTVPAL
jgi:hypothetical protein